jgi:hypothetical protein
MSGDFGTSHVRKKLTWAWHRLGQPAALSPIAGLIYLPFGLLGPLIIDRSRFGGSFLMWLFVGLVGQSALMLVMWVGKTLIVRINKAGHDRSHPPMVITVLVLAIVARAMALGWLAYLLQLTPTFEIEYRLRAGAMGQLVALIMCAILASATVHHVNLTRSLESERLALENLSRQIIQRLRSIQESIRAEVEKSITPLIQQIGNLAHRGQLDTESQKVQSVVARIIDEDLRPLSHRLASEVSIDIDQLSLQSSEPVRRLAIPSRIGISFLVRPILVAVLVGVMGASQAMRDRGALEILVNTVLIALLVASILWILRWCLRGWTPQTWVAAPMAGALTVLSIGLVYWINTLIDNGIAGPIGIVGVIAIFVIAIVSVAFSLTETTVLKQEEQLLELNAELIRAVSTLRQQEFIARKNLSYVIHGAIQGSLHASLMRLAASERPSVELIDSIRSDIVNATQKLNDSSSNYTYLVDTLSEIVDLWEGVCDVTWTLGYRTVSLLAGSPTTAMSVAEIVRECIANSVRHGKASKASVDISPQNDLVIVTVIDNGLGESPDAHSGLGSHMMNELCVSWCRESSETGTRVEANVSTVNDA